MLFFCCLFFYFFFDGRVTCEPKVHKSQVHNLSMCVCVCVCIHTYLYVHQSSFGS